jgi:hypothetical protein
MQLGIKRPTSSRISGKRLSGMITGPIKSMTIVISKLIDPLYSGAERSHWSKQLFAKTNASSSVPFQQHSPVSRFQRNH